MNMDLFQRSLEKAFKAGHFWNRANPNGLNVTQADLANLKPTDQIAIDALVSYAKSDFAYSEAVFRFHKRMPNFDGQVGPAMAALIEIPRCPVPDHAPPPGVSFAFEDPDTQRCAEHMQAMGSAEATGPGSWRGCNGYDNAHCAIVVFDTRRLPSFLKPGFIQCLTVVQAAYATRGLLFIFVENSKDLITGKADSRRANVTLEFVSNPSGWIGLAVVGQGETCSSQAIWGKFAIEYVGGSTLAEIIVQWTALIAHELGHIAGFGHSNGGIMNPSIQRNQKPWADDDPTTAKIIRAYSGVPIAVPGSDGPVPPLPPPKDSTQEQLDQMKAQLAAHFGMLKYIIGRLP